MRSLPSGRALGTLDLLYCDKDDIVAGGPPLYSHQATRRYGIGDVLCDPLSRLFMILKTCTLVIMSPSMKSISGAVGQHREFSFLTPLDRCN